MIDRKNWNDAEQCYEALVNSVLIRAWYDRAMRLWTVQAVDSAGNQIGEVTYTGRRENVLLVAGHVAADARCAQAG